MVLETECERFSFEEMGVNCRWLLSAINVLALCQFSLATSLYGEFVWFELLRVTLVRLEVLLKFCRFHFVLDFKIILLEP